MTEQEFRTKYKDAVDAECLNRIASFIDCPSETVDGFSLYPLTLRKHAILRAIDSPLILGGEPTPNDLALFLWVTGGEYSENKTKRNAFFELCHSIFFPPDEIKEFDSEIQAKDFSKKMLDSFLEFEKILKVCYEYIRNQTQDKLPSVVSSSKIQPPEYYSDYTSIVGRIARAYGWSEESILDIPITRIFQYLREIYSYDCASNGVNPVMVNSSDLTKTEFLKGL